MYRMIFLSESGSPGFKDVQDDFFVDEKRININ
jgi:hypothetical protein